MAWYPRFTRSMPFRKYQAHSCKHPSYLYELLSPVGKHGQLRLSGSDLLSLRLINPITNSFFVVIAQWLNTSKNRRNGVCQGAKCKALRGEKIGRRAK